MNVALRTTMTLEQFLACEERQELRYELDGFQAAIQRNLTTGRAVQLRDAPCQPYGSDPSRGHRVQHRRNYRNPAA